MACGCPPTDTLGLAMYCVCTTFAAIGCRAPAIKVEAKLMVADPCDPPMLSEGALVLPFCETFWPGQCVQLPATTGTDPATYINGSGYYQITVWDLETNTVLFGPVHVDISSDNDPEECVDLTNLLVAC